MKSYAREVIVSTLVMIILFLTIILLDSEVSLPFNLMNIVESIAALGTLIAAIAAWKSANAANSSAKITSEQLREMQQARESQIKPDIYIASKDYQIKFNPDRGFGDFNYKKGTPNLIVTNIGQGHAKNINFKWLFISMDEDVEFIRKYKIGKEKIVIYEPDERFLVRESGSGPLKDDLRNFTPLILKDEHFQLRMPFSYLEVLSLKYFLILENTLDRHILPKINLEVNYRGGDGKDFVKKYLISPNIFNSECSTADGKLNNYTSLVNFNVDELF